MRNRVFSGLESSPAVELALRSEEECELMSFEQVVHELNELDGEIIDEAGVMRLTRQGTDVKLTVLRRIINRQDESIESANQLSKSLDGFKVYAESRLFWTTDDSFDPNFQNGKGVIVNSIAGAGQMAGLQSLLEGSSVSEPEVLSGNIDAHDKSVEESINMIYGERYGQRQSDGTGKELCFRSGSVDISELTKEISYTDATQNPSRYFSDLHQGLVGTTKWGGAVAYADERKQRLGGSKGLRFSSGGETESQSHFEMTWIHPDRGRPISIQIGSEFCRYRKDDKGSLFDGVVRGMESLGSSPRLALSGYPVAGSPNFCCGQIRSVYDAGTV